MAPRCVEGDFGFHPSKAATSDFGRVIIDGVTIISCTCSKRKEIHLTEAKKSFDQVAVFTFPILRQELCRMIERVL